MTTTTPKTGQWADAFEAAGKRFVGHVTNKIDAKGRVSVPADLRRALDGPVATPDVPPAMMRVTLAFTGLALWGGGPDLHEVLYDIAKSDGSFVDAERERALQDAIFEDVELLKFDDNGRVTLPPILREEAALDTHVTFAGRGSYFVIGDAERMAAERRERRALMRDRADILHTRASPTRVSRKGGPAS